jgi:hypothetical protein
METVQSPEKAMDVELEELPDSTLAKSVAFSRHVENIDVDDEGNPQLLAEYVNDIYGYLRKLETKQEVTLGYLEITKCKYYVSNLFNSYLLLVYKFSREKVMKDYPFLQTAKLTNCLLLSPNHTEDALCAARLAGRGFAAVHTPSGDTLHGCGSLRSFYVQMRRQN